MHGTQSSTAFYATPAPAYEPNWILAYLYRRFFEHIQVDEAWVEVVRRAAAQGSVVYVLRNLSFWDFLALDHLTKRYQLPRIRFANDLGLWVLEPMGKGWLRALVPTSRNAAADRLVSVIEEGGSAALFLKRPPSMMNFAAGRAGLRRSMTEGDDLMRALFALQRRRAQPILLVPQVFVWSKLPDERRPGVLDAFLGTREWPGKIRTTLEFLRNYGHVAFRAGEPVDLQEYLASADTEGDGDDRAIIRRLTYSVLRKLERERRSVVGPAKKPLDRVRSEVVKSPKLQSIIRDLAGEGSAERLVLTQRAYTILRELEAQPDPGLVGMVEPLFDYVINKIYDGIEVDQEGLERVRQAARRGTLVLLPSHKSHVDYIVLHYICHKNDLQLPLVAAGDNLAFFPLGMLFRRAGAFFIRRTFSNDRLYAAVVDAYVRRLIREGHSIEFYIEGGRSRTGKLLSPKLGLLSMAVDAASSVPQRDVFFVPVSIGYDRLMEGGSYVHENMGGEKRKEDARGLLHTLRLLRGRYGRLSVQFGTILAFDRLLQEASGAAPPEPCGNGASGSISGSGAGTGLPAWREQAAKQLTPAKRRALVTKLAHRVLGEINRATAVTAGAVVATLLLNDPRRGISHGELVNECTQMVKLLEHLGAPISRSLLGPGGSVRESAIAEAARLFVDADLVTATVPGQAGTSARRRRARIYTGPDVVYGIQDDKRPTLDISKNLIVHFFVPRAILASAFVSACTQVPLPEAGGPRAQVTRSTFDDRVRTLARLFKYEFTFYAETTTEQSFTETLRQMVRDSELDITQTGEITFGAGEALDSPKRISFYASILRTFLEGYRVAARGLGSLLRGPLVQKELVRRSIAVGERMFLARDIERREAVGRTLIENAHSAFVDQGYITMQQRKVTLSESFATAAAVGTIEGRVAGYLAPRGGTAKPTG